MPEVCEVSANMSEIAIYDYIKKFDGNSHHESGTINVSVHTSSV